MSYTIYGAAITPAVLCALLWKGVTKAGGITSMLLGSIFTIVWELQKCPFRIQTVILIGVIYSAVSNKKKDDEIRSTVKDINYCRSVAAQYGQQGSEEFRNSYYSCLDGRNK